jgi:hypothetical protein
VVTGATLELNIADFARSTGREIGTLLFEKPGRGESPPWKPAAATATPTTPARSPACARR